MLDSVARNIKSFMAKKSIHLALVLNVAVFIYVFGQGIVFQGDSKLYIEKSICRLPLYPLVLEAFKSIFGVSQLYWLVFFQIIWVLAAATYLSILLKKHFHLPVFAYFIVHFLLVSPLLPAHRIFGGIFGGIGNTVMTESLSYGIFLFSFAFLIKNIFQPSYINGIVLIGLCVINSLVRFQFVFMYPVIFMLFGYRYFKDRELKKITILCMVFIICIITANILTRVYHYNVNGRFENFSLTNTFFLTNLLYLAEPSDLNEVAESPQKKILQKIMITLQQKQLTEKYSKAHDAQFVGYYDKNFNAILWDVLIPQYSNAFANRFSEDDLFFEVERFSKYVLPDLLKKRLMAGVKLTIMKFLDSFNFREGFFLAVLLVLPVWRFERPINIVLLLTAVAMVMSRLVIAPLVYFVDRLVFYTDMMEPVMLFVLLGWRMNERSITPGGYIQKLKKLEVIAKLPILVCHSRNDSERESGSNCLKNHIPDRDIWE
ncbi:MAG: hypothetical protein M0P74_15100 [Syntrophales bacterium]|jgi:hypothetical protein|nr:hypothetical protein [Syntrophales bacterium]